MKTRRQRVKETLRGKRAKRKTYKLCKCGCGEKFLKTKNKKFVAKSHCLRYHSNEYIIRKVYKICKCGCGEKFLKTRNKKFVDKKHCRKYHNDEYRIKIALSERY